MIKRITNLFLTCSVLVFAQGVLKAQTLENIKSRFPGEQAVVLNATLHYNISIKNGLPVIESKETQKIMYLSANAVAHMGRYAFFHSSFHEIREYAAYTQTTGDKKIKVTDFKTSNSTSASVFYDDVKETRFNFPSIAEGATGNLEIVMSHKKPYLLTPYYFTHYIPVVHSELKITYKKDIGIKYVLKGLDTSLIKVSKEEKRDNIIYTFQVNDLPADREYNDAPDNAWYSPHVVFYIEHYKNEHGEKINFLSDTNDLYKLNRSFLKDLNKEAGLELKRITDSLTANKTKDEEKARAIYSWVQQHIKYVAFEEGMEGFIPRDPNFVCNRRYGDCKDMSSILTTMLNTAGIKAYYTWIGTRKIPYTYQETPVPIVDNHMICAIRLKDDYIFLDGTDPYCVFGMPPESIQDKEALISISDTDYKIVKVPIVPKSKNLILDSTFMELTNDGINGEIKKHFTGYPARATHSLLNYINDRDRENQMNREFSRGSNKFKLTSFTNGIMDDKNKALLTGTFTLQDYAKKVGDDWFINLNLFKFYENQEIDIPRRSMPIEFNFLYSSSYVTVLKIPEGYEVSHLPASKSFKNDTWGFDIKYEQKGNTIILTQHFSNDHLMLYKDKFDAWNEVLRHLFPLYKESISLSKKSI